MIDFYNNEVRRYQLACTGLSKPGYPDIAAFIDSNPTKISWTRAIRNDLGKFTLREFDGNSLIRASYRPFSKQWMYYNRRFNEVVSQMPRIFPDASVRNLAICLSGPGSQRGFSVLMVNALPDLHTIQTGQCFPLKLFEAKVESSKNQSLPGMDDEDVSGRRFNEKDAITDASLQHFKDAYKEAVISKEDLFYYIYGLLHSEDYKKRYADNLSKELPRIPAVKKFADFQAFSTAGRELADLHINYETVAPYQVEIVGGALLLANFTDADYRVTQMKFASKAEKTSVFYNHKITMSGIPLEAYDYVVNGKPALEWVMERQAVTTHKDSGIVNDANLWAIETMGDASYPLKLFQRVITVSLETMKIVRALPRLDIALPAKV
jgi:predicted helicase